MQFLTKYVIIIREIIIKKEGINTVSNKYLIKTYNNCIETIKPNSSILVYKVPYSEIKKETLDIEIINRFIVYILIGKNADNKDIIYVGKSKNGIDNRPTAHEEEGKKWKTCYVLTTLSEKTFFNDGTIQYIEDQIHQRIKQLKDFENTTKTTISNTVSSYDSEYCDEYIEEVYKILYILGLDLNIEEDIYDTIPNNKKEVPCDLEDMYNNICNTLKNDFELNIKE